MTMANATSATPHRPSPTMSSASLRKTNKPLMEKRRRARINDSLGQLKSLVIQSSKKDSSQFNKLEKADILEMTVKHLRSLHTQQQSQQTDATASTKYTAGFMECANEVMRFLKQSSGFSDEIKTRVVGHLANCLQHQVPRPSTVAAPRLNPAPAATAQLTNGQFIQIVNTPFQQQSQVTVQQAPILVATSVPAMPQAQQTAQAPAAPSAQRSLPEPVPQESSPSYSRYCQPLHIQIPSTESPLLVKQIPQAAIPPSKSESLSNSHISASSHISRPASPRSSTSMSTSSTSSPSPIHFPTGQRSSAYKQLDFYANDNYSDYDPRYRTYSSTSSSESEMMSPLNLSQSPPYDSQREYPHPIVRPETVDNQYHLEKQAAKDADLTSSFTSVIVNHKKALDIPSAKYMRMMYEDRQCVRSQGTPSPASSMGETAVWRPW